MSRVIDSDVGDKDKGEVNVKSGCWFNSDIPNLVVYPFGFIAPVTINLKIIINSYLDAKSIPHPLIPVPVNPLIVTLLAVVSYTIKL